MNKIDVRKLDSSAREALRNTVIRLHEKGHKQAQLCRDLGLRKATVNAWVSRYKETGKAGLKDKKTGRPLGYGKTLTEAQEKRIQKDIVDRTPDQMKLNFALWNARAVGELIYQLFMIRMPVRTVRNYLLRWGFTPQRPVKRAYERQDKKVQQWLQEDYPLIVERARKEKAEISWGDETGVSSDEHYARGYAPKGKTPILVISRSKRVRVNLISTVTNQGELRFMAYKGSMTAQVMIRFMKQLITHAKRKVFLILDNLRVHHSKLVKEWVAGNADMIELFYLPSYSPELNPDEYFNCDLKAELNKRAPTRNEKQMTRKVRSVLYSLQKQPARIKSYFQHQNIAYAA
jgi:transposase